MNDKTKEPRLFSEFPPVSTKEWEEKIKEDLKGADYEKKLIWKTSDEISVKPYYRAEDLGNLEYLDIPPAEFPFVRGNKKDDNNWEIRYDIEEASPGKANRIALDAIRKGAQALGFNGKETDSNEDMEVLLKEIDLTAVSVHFTSSSSFPHTYKLFVEEINRQKIDAGKIRGSFNFDSLSYFLLFGKFYASQDNNFIEAATFVADICKNLPNVKAITINGQYIHNAGASIVQELAFSLSSANEYLVQLTNKKINIDGLAPAIQFVFATGSNYFMEIAKIRAARILWAKIVEQYKPHKGSSAMTNIHIVTSLWNKSVYDPYVNMLRTTTEAMSAAIGGCDSMTVKPFDIAYKKPDEFSERIAQNTQLILKEESYLDKIIDPSAGSYYIENLTDSIADAAWKLFLETEEKGGFIKSAESGFIKEEIEKTCRKRDMDIAMRKQVILGTNQYPNPKEKMLDKFKPPADISRLGGLQQYRGAHAFEALRLAAEAYEKDGNKQPSVFLFTYGNPSMRKARAAFTTNFFGCAGYEIINNPGFKTIEEGVIAASGFNAGIVVFCSSDEEYAGSVPEACKQLKAQNPEIVVMVAGNPAGITEELKQAGVDEFIHLGSNVLSTLWKYHRELGII